MPRTRDDSTDYLRLTINSDHDLANDVVLIQFVDTRGSSDGFHMVQKVGPGTQTTNADGTVSWVTPYRLLVGPGTGGLLVRPGTYQVWARVGDTPESPVFPSGYFAVTPAPTVQP